MILLHCQQAGHDVIALVGSATAKCGDPSGRFTDRDQLEADELDRNVKGITKCIRYVFNNYESDSYPGRLQSSLPPLKILYNGDWYKNINVIDFITNVFKNFRLANLLAMKSIRDRSTTSSSDSMLLSEFVYQVFQSYDWLHLHDQYKCNFQIGGIDQLCNVQSGVKLLKRSRNADGVFGLFTPLLTTPKGEKLGKSLNNTVWLSPEKTSPFEFYQYFFRQPDSVVEEYLKYFTFIQLNEIENIMMKHNKSPHLRNAQMVLAKNVTKIVHGVEGLQSAERCTRALFYGGIEDLERLTQDEITITFSNTAIVDAVLEPDTTILDALLMTKMLQSSENAENLFKNKAVRINGQVTTSSHQVLLSDVHVLINNITLVTIGKKRHCLLRWSLPRISHKEDDFKEDHFETYH